MDTQGYEIELLSDDELNSVVGGAMNDFTNYTKWANDPSPDKLPWNPAFPPGRPR
jgi:bacteriocin-like protein